MRETIQSRVLKVINSGVYRVTDMTRDLQSLTKSQINSACINLAKDKKCTAVEVSFQKFEYHPNCQNVHNALLSQKWTGDFKADWSSL